MMDGADIKTLERVIAKCKEKERVLNQRGSLSQARVAHELAGSFRSMLHNAQKRQQEAARPRCRSCGTTENLHEDLGSGGPWRCNSPDCVVF